jgi:hypothetical protein
LDYGIQKKEFTLNAYTDVDLVDSVDDRKSTSGGTFFLGKCLVAWISKKKTSISLSTIET